MPVDEPEGGFLNPDGTPWTPQFEGQRAPWQPGNEFAAKPGNDLAVTHGAYSASRVEPLAAQIIATTMQDTGLEYLKSPRFAIALHRWSRSEARKQLIEAWVDGMSVEESARSDRGQVSPAELLRRWTVSAENSASKLGLDPVSAAKIASYVSSTHKNLDLSRLLSGLDKAGDD